MGVQPKSAPLAQLSINASRMRRVLSSNGVDKGAPCKGDPPVVDAPAHPLLTSPVLLARIASFLPLEDPGLHPGLLCSCQEFAKAAKDPLVCAEVLLQRRQGPHPLPLTLHHLFTLKAAAAWTDDQLYLATAHLLKHGVDVSEACKQVPSPADPQQPATKQDEVAVLTNRVATRTLALLIKQRPSCAIRLKAYETLRAGVLSNKEYTLLFLVARGADAKPHLAPLVLEAIRHGASKALTWLLQWHDDVTSDKLRAQLQAGLPSPLTCTCHDTAATLEVLLAHGLTANCTLQCTQQGSLAGPSETASTYTLLEWAVLHASAAAKARGAWPPVLPKPPSPAPTPKGASTPQGPPERAEHSSNGAHHSTPGTPLPTLSSRSSSSSGAASYGGPELVRVVIKAGANLNANKGAALLLAAQAHRGDLVAELVAGGADVTLPRLPNNTDLVRWAVDTKQCPTDSNVLQALLSASQKVDPIPATPVRLQDPLFTRTLSTRRVGSNQDLKTPPPPVKIPASNGKENGTTAHAPVSPAPSLPSRASALGASVSPMVTLGGKQVAAAAAAVTEPEAQPVNGSSNKSQGGGSFLPSSLQTELQRDEAFLEAVARNDLQVVRCMLEAGADVHFKQDKALLLAMGAIDPEQPAKWMPRPRDRAPVLSMSRPMVDLLISHGADVNARSGRALCQAARWRDDYSMKYILSLPGADKTWLDKDPTLAAHLAGSKRF